MELWDYHFTHQPTPVVAISDNDSSVLANITLGGCPALLMILLSMRSMLPMKHTVSVISDESNSVVATIEPNTTLSGEPSSMVYDSGKGEMFAIYVTKARSALLMNTMLMES